MLMSLRDIFNSLTPSNLNEIPLVRTAKEIFIACIERNSQVAKRITNIFDVTEREEDTELINRAKRNLKIGLYQTYIYGLYKYLQALSTNSDMIADLKKFNYQNSALYKDIHDIINTEFIQTHHLFTQKVGTESAMRYMYSFSKYLETGELLDDLEVKEGYPFIINYEGSLGRRLYNEFTRPQTHPIGWLDHYETVFKLVFQDYFGIEILDDFTKIELNCNESWVVFIKDDQVQNVLDDFSNRINPITMQPYTEDEISRYVTVIPNKVVSTYRKYIDSFNCLITVFTFTDRTVLYHNETSPKITYYTTYEDYLSNFKEPLEVWDDCWDLDSEMQTNFRFLYEDQHYFLKDHFVTMIKEDNGGAVGLTCYNELSVDSMFRVQGHEMQHLQGVDESKNKCLDYDNVHQKYTDKFTATFQVTLECPSDVMFKDKFNHNKLWSFQEESGEYSINTCDFNGRVYSITINDAIFDLYGFEATGMNDFDRMVHIQDFILDYEKCKFLGVINPTSTGTETITVDSLYSEPKKNKEYYIKVTFTWNSMIYHKVQTVTGYYDISTSKYSFNFLYKVGMDDKEFEFKIELYRKNGKFITDEYVKGPYASRVDSLYAHVSLLKYTDVTVPKPQSEPISSMQEIPYFTEFHPDVPCRIGERPPYDQENYYLGLLLRTSSQPKPPYSPDGKVWIGVPYELSNYDNFKEDNTFIYLGFKDTCLDSSELFISDSPNFVQDELEFDQTWAQGYYLYTTVSPELGNDPGSYLFSRDRYYFYTNEKHLDGDYRVTVTFELNGGTGMHELKVKQGAMFSVVKDSFGFPRKDGYVFSYWSFGKGKDEIPGTYHFDDDVTVYANYVLADVTITMKADKSAQWVPN